MGEFIQAIWGGALFGSVYGLMAVGLTLIWGCLNLLNLAHGVIYLGAAYAAYALLAGFGLPILIAFGVGLLVAALLGALLYGSVVRPMLGRPGWDTASWIGTFGFAFVAENVLRLVFGPRVKQLPVLLEGHFTIQGISITHHGLVVVAVAVVALLGLNFFLRTSRHGLAIRAVSQQAEASMLMGIPTGRVFFVVLCVSAALAGLAGLLLTSLLVLSPFAGFLPLLKALIITIFGGLGSVKGTIVGAYLIGTLEATTQVYLGVRWSLPVLFTFIIVVLIVRPYGLFGGQETQRL